MKIHYYEYNWSYGLCECKNKNAQMFTNIKEHITCKKCIVKLQKRLGLISYV